MPVDGYPWVSRRRGVVYDALHRFVHPDGYRLSDRVWRNAGELRIRIDRLLEYHVREGTAAVKVAKELEEFLRRERLGIRTRKPYGRWGSYDARRLARTEITAALGRGVIAAAHANPFVNQIEWAMSPTRTGDWDCDCPDNEAGGPYDIDDVPQYPAHAHCMCTLRPITVPTEEAIEDIRAWLQGEESREDYSSLFDLTDLLFTLLRLWKMAGFEAL